MLLPTRKAYDSMTETKTYTRTFTVSASVGAVWTQVESDILERCRKFAHVTKDFDLADMMPKIGLLALHDALDAVYLEVYMGTTIIAEYAFFVADETPGRAADSFNDLTAASIPRGARMRISVETNPRRDPAYCIEWMRKLGFYEAPDLQMPEGAQSAYLGSFSNGGYAVDRHARLNPGYVSAPNTNRYGTRR